jgi:serine/threonine-protein kinase
MAEDTNAGTIKGKVSYMAPEQIFGKNVDRRADVWAIGAVLHHILSGAPPFDSDNAASTLRKVMGEDAPAPLPERVPREIADVILRSLEKDQDKRIPTAAMFRAELERAMQTSGQTATTDQVAAYCAEQLAEREALRRSSLVTALTEAAERAKGKPASIPPPAGGPSLEDSIARMSPSERAALAVKLAGGLNDSAGDAESAARLLVALGAAMRTSNGISDASLRVPTDAASVGAAVSAPRPAEKRTSFGGVLAVLLVAIASVGVVFGARRYLLSAPESAPAAVQPTAVASQPPAPSISVAAPESSAAPAISAATTPTPSALSAAAHAAPDAKVPIVGKKKAPAPGAKPTESGEAPRVDDGF